MCWALPPLPPSSYRSLTCVPRGSCFGVGENSIPSSSSVAGVAGSSSTGSSSPGTSTGGTVLCSACAAEALVVLVTLTVVSVPLMVIVSGVLVVLSFLGLGFLSRYTSSRSSFAVLLSNELVCDTKAACGE